MLMLDDDSVHDTASSLYKPEVSAFNQHGDYVRSLVVYTPAAAAMIHSWWLRKLVCTTNGQCRVHYHWRNNGQHGEQLFSHTLGW